MLPCQIVECLTHIQLIMETSCNIAIHWSILIWISHFLANHHEQNNLGLCETLLYENYRSPISRFVKVHLPQPRFSFLLPGGSQGGRTPCQGRWDEGCDEHRVHRGDETGGSRRRWSREEKAFVAESVERRGNQEASQRGCQEEKELQTEEDADTKGTD